jgi:hypothetical protein
MPPPSASASLRGISRSLCRGTDPPGSEARQRDRRHARGSKGCGQLSCWTLGWSTKTVVRVFRKETRNGRGKVSWYVGRDVSEKRRWLGAVGGEELPSGFSLERRSSRQGEKRHGPKTVNITAYVHGRLTRRLLGAHVRGRPENHSGPATAVIGAADINRRRNLLWHWKDAIVPRNGRPTGKWSDERFGKPERGSNCDCERVKTPSPSQAVFPQNDLRLRRSLARVGLIPVFSVYFSRFSTCVTLARLMPKYWPRAARLLNF